MILFSAAVWMHALVLMLRVQGSGGSFPKPLSSEEEAACLQAMSQGDANARDKLTLHNLRLVAHIAKKYYAEPADQDDLISIGTIGLIKAVNTYKPDRAVRLATYAARCIENAMVSQRRRLILRKLQINGIFWRNRHKMSGYVAKTMRDTKCTMRHYACKPCSNAGQALGVRMRNF